MSAAPIYHDHLAGQSYTRASGAARTLREEGFNAWTEQGEGDERGTFWLATNAPEDLAKATLVAWECI